MNNDAHEISSCAFRKFWYRLRYKYNKLRQLCPAAALPACLSPVSALLLLANCEPFPSSDSGCCAPSRTQCIVGFWVLPWSV